MSWDTYVKNLVDGGMKDGAIAGLENGGWMVAASGSSISRPEIDKILNGMKDPSTFQASGLWCGGVKYMYLSGDGKLARGKKGTGGVHISKSNTTVLIGVYDERLQPPQAAQLVEKLTAYLESVGS